ncbi:MAG: tetratricopeptide repeat protein [Proteobacteria bacterium]|nr:tetratricopeptide repeat protein [Pseudomonadota bacterium]
MSFVGSVGQLETILARAESALAEDDPDAALDLCDQILGAAPNHSGALFLAGLAHRDLGNVDYAEVCFRRVIALSPNQSTPLSGLGAVLYDQLRFDEAQPILNRAIEIDPQNAEGYYWRAMLRQRRGDNNGSLRDFFRAGQLEPLSFPRPLPLDDSTVEVVVQEALMAMNPTIRTYLTQVVIILDEFPSIETCEQFDPPALPSELLGYFAGIPITERSMGDPWSILPSTIVLFRKNLERFAPDRERLLEELRLTIFHEVGHFLGMDEDELSQRGLE